jgi:hypothetical protein
MKILCPEQMLEAMQHCMKTEDYSLLECLMSLLQVEKIRQVEYGENMETIIVADRAPISFEWRRWLTDPETGKQIPRTNGGIIYHGQYGERGGNAPTFSVSITNSPGWQVHT